VSVWLAPLRLAADYALPPRCPGCGAVTGADHRFCAACWGKLHFLTPPWCASCHHPFGFDRGAGAVCNACAADPPPHRGVDAAVAYGDVARTVALRLKYGGRIAFAETIARQIRRLMPDGAELIVPVPLHRWRLWARGFNQAALIGAALSRATDVPSAPMLLRRTRATPPLRGMGAKARATAVAGVFRVVDPAGRLRDKAVVLVDDIHTSGATSGGCTRALLDAGARSVSILCWARVIGTIE
jgi:ComF family protein